MLDNRRAVTERPCDACARFAGDKSCEAFPRGIPQEILEGDNDHTTEVAGDGGLRFKEVRR